MEEQGSWGVGAEEEEKRATDIEPVLQWTLQEKHTRTNTHGGFWNLWERDVYF